MLCKIYPQLILYKNPYIGRLGPSKEWLILKQSLISPMLQLLMKNFIRKSYQSYLKLSQTSFILVIFA